MRSLELYRGKEQTYVKHFFLERYLQTVAFHIGFFQREFVYVDCFSGPWRAGDEEFADSSIRIALSRLNYVRDGLAAQGRNIRVRAIFIEKSQRAFADLQRTLKQYSRAVKTAAFPGTFKDNIPEILREVGSAFAFFFIDPWGWTGFAIDDMRPILLHKPGEVMVNFMYDSVNRFMNSPDPAHEKSLDGLFGTRRWREIRDSSDREEASVGLYIEQLRAAGAFNYMTSTRILKPLHDRAYFHLIYATRSAKGILESARSKEGSSPNKRLSEPPRNGNTVKPARDKLNLTLRRREDSRKAGKRNVEPNFRKPKQKSANSCAWDHSPTERSSRLSLSSHWSGTPISMRCSWTLTGVARSSFRSLLCDNARQNRVI